jgi:hypothetical protein
MWTCPLCGRSFRNTQQRHRCERTTAQAQLKNQPDIIVQIYQKIIDTVDKIGHYTKSPIKDYIMLKNRSTFLTIKPRKRYLDISFFLSEKSEDFPIFNSMQTSKNRIAHVARLESPKDVSSTVRSWIKKSYQLTAGNDKS